MLHSIQSAISYVITFIFIIAIWFRYYCYSHFTDEETSICHSLYNKVNIYWNKSLVSESFS